MDIFENVALLGVWARSIEVQYCVRERTAGSSYGQSEIVRCINWVSLRRGSSRVSARDMNIIVRRVDFIGIISHRGIDLFVCVLEKFSVMASGKE